jgi:hypothetical protein
MKQSVVMTTNAREGELIMLPAVRPNTFSSSASYPKIIGPWLVVKAKMAGGSHGHDPYPDGWQVTVQRLNNKNKQPMPKTEFVFYQSGCFNIIIPEVQAIGKMKKKVTTVWA